MKMNIREVEQKLNLFIGFNKELPVKVTFAINRNKVKLESLYKDFLKNKENLLNKYAMKDKDGTLSVKDNNYVFENDEIKKKFIDEVNELLDYEEELDLKKISLREIEHLSMTSNELAAIDFMINEK